MPVKQKSRRADSSFGITSMERCGQRPEVTAMSPSSFLYHCHLKTHPDSKYKVPISGCTHPLLSSCYHALYPAMFFNSNKNAEHKYVSLMFEASNYYASWDPLRPVRIGDYGRLQSDHSFAPEGNIFDDGFAEEFGIETTTSGQDRERWIQSLTTNEIKVNGEVGLSHPPGFKGGMKKSFVISSSYGAILGMFQPRYTSITYPGRLKQLFNAGYIEEKHVLVSEVYTCRSYARLLAPRQRHRVEISLDVSDPMQLAYGKARLEWNTNADGGDFKYACPLDDDTKAVCTPLFKLIGRPRRGLSGLYAHGPFMAFKLSRRSRASKSSGYLSSDDDEEFEDAEAYEDDEDYEDDWDGYDTDEVGRYQEPEAGDEDDEYNSPDSDRPAKRRRWF